jgi:hypothetical protein
MGDGAHPHFEDCGAAFYGGVDGSQTDLASEDVLTLASIIGT